MANKHLRPVTKLKLFAKNFGLTTFISYSLVETLRTENGIGGENVA